MRARFKEYEFRPRVNYDNITFSTFTLSYNKSNAYVNDLVFANIKIVLSIFYYWPEEANKFI